MLEVLDPGPEASVQDQGRVGYGHLGVPRAGAVDLPSLELGNRILGNGPDAAGVEILLGRAAFRAQQDCLVALTGAACPATVARRPVSFNQPIWLRAGEQLSLGSTVLGLRSYLTVRGGIATPTYLGSRSTDTLSGVGPQLLAAGDLLPIGIARAVGPPRGLDFHSVPVPHPLLDTVLPFRWGPRHTLFDEAALQALVTQAWEVSSEASRVGVRLIGNPLTTGATGGLPTEALHVGSIQIPPAGLPLVFLANSPPTGGYPVIGVVERAALARLAQLAPGNRVSFSPIERLPSLVPRLLRERS